jgi:AraC family transcriptional regulator of adaptative response / DNA-3-methyladenine glycosylase II
VLISVIAARGLAGQLVCFHGDTLPKDHGRHPALSHVFPPAAQLAALEDIDLAMPGSRRLTLKAVSQATVDDPNLFSPFGDIDAVVKRLSGIRGVGDWTAQYIAMRAIREMDAFPATDIGLLRGAAAIRGTSSDAKQLLPRAECWRPWRAYAAQHLWAVDAATFQSPAPRK